MVKFSPAILKEQPLDVLYFNGYLKFDFSFELLSSL